MKALEEAAKQFGKNLEQLPGWGMLVIFLYIVAFLLDLPQEITLSGRLTISLDFLVAAITILLYQVGDALDKAIFSRSIAHFPKHWLEIPRNKARCTLVIHDGVYAIAKSLAIAEGKYQTIPIQWYNESAKFLRSLSLPLIIIGLYFAFARNQYLLASVMIVFGLVLIPLYVLLKARHMHNLYMIVPHLVDEKAKYEAYNINDVRLFFWKGVLVGSAIQVVCQEQALM